MTYVFGGTLNLAQSINQPTIQTGHHNTANVQLNLRQQTRNVDILYNTVYHFGVQ